MEAVFYSNFSKKINSTKRPSGGTTRQVRLKEACPLLNPVFLLDTVNYSYNYVKWEGRYYWINDIVALTNNVGEYHCSVDVLASWKNDIGNTKAYILRSSNLSNGKIIDTMYPTTAVSTRTRSTATLSDNITDDIESGKFVVGVMGRDSDGVGAATYYALSNSTFRALKNFLMDPEQVISHYGIDTGEISEALFKAVFNPAQYIISAMWLPLENIIAKSTSAIYFGWWEATINAQVLGSDTVWSQNGSIKIPKHPKQLTRGKYLNQSPYAEYALNTRMFGYIPLDPADLIDADELSYWIKIDEITGLGVLEYGIGLNIIGRVTAQVGVPIQLGQLSVDTSGITGLAGSILSAGASLATGNILGLIGGTAGAVGSVGSMVKGASLGSNGTFAQISKYISIEARFLDITEEDLNHKGRPLCMDKRIGSLSGYMLCGDGDVDTSATAEEKQSIKSFLEGGFFYE